MPIVPLFGDIRANDRRLSCVFYSKMYKMQRRYNQRVVAIDGVDTNLFIYFFFPHSAIV